MLLTINSYLQLGYLFTLLILVGLFIQNWFIYIKSINLPKKSKLDKNSQ
ncbi:hypothetical protein Trichorick_00481 [Candidatus Trichorickettsia mobilis]|uniref:ATP synthase F0 subunit 8 n=1 Tax=Candidatus Trichorickettsia mobilis TaxID=1346319 RepID=A0ABZ0URD1_9RICK|nr:hypothetical protein Trichorick_00481 [Candidatus Trichorickettsia mobilis]